jgi:hypothetical protein
LLCSLFIFTGHNCQYLVRENEQEIFEIVKFDESPRSWFIDNSVLQGICKCHAKWSYYVCQEVQNQLQSGFLMLKVDALTKPILTIFLCKSYMQDDTVIVRGVLGVTPLKKMGCQQNEDTVSKL